MTDSNPSEPIIYDFDPRNLPDEYLRAIGLVITAGSQTEDILQDFIGGLLKIDLIETRALTAHMSLPLKDDIARAVAELNAPTVAEMDLVDELLDAIWDAMQKRNSVAHNAFCRHPKTGDVMCWRESARGSLRGTLTPIKAEEIEDDAALIQTAGLNLQAFMEMRNIAPFDRKTPLRKYVKRSKEARKARFDALRKGGG